MKQLIWLGMIQLVVGLALLLPSPVPAAAQTPSCQFVLGFKTLHDLIPAQAGECIENQSYAGNGDAQQHTTKGLMAWRKADNWTAFTNGYMTWINGPKGLVSRLNTARFPWEADSTANQSASGTRTVLFAESLSDPNAGQLPKIASAAVRAGYVDGEYQLQTLSSGSSIDIPLPAMPVYKDAAIAIDARIVGDTNERFVGLVCRDQGDGSSYEFTVHPFDASFNLVRWDGPQPSYLAANTSTAIRKGNDVNRLELSCEGNTITAVANGQTLAVLTDGTYSQGYMRLFAWAHDGTVDSRFRNLLVTGPASGAGSAPPALPQGQPSSPTDPAGAPVLSCWWQTGMYNIAGEAYACQYPAAGRARTPTEPVNSIWDREGPGGAWRLLVTARDAGVTYTAAGLSRKK